MCSAASSGSASSGVKAAPSARRNSITCVITYTSALCRSVQTRWWSGRTSTVIRQPPASVTHRPDHQRWPPSSVAEVSRSGPCQSGRLNQCATIRCTGTSALPVEMPFDHPPSVPRTQANSCASPPGRRSSSVTVVLFANCGGASGPALHSRPGLGAHDSWTTPATSVVASPPSGPSCNTTGWPGSLNGYTGESGSAAFGAKRSGTAVMLRPLRRIAVLAHPRLVLAAQVTPRSRAAFRGRRLLPGRRTGSAGQRP